MNKNFTSENSGRRKQNSFRNTDKAMNFKRLGRILAMQYLFQCDLQEEVQNAVSLDQFWIQAEESGKFSEEKVFRKARRYAEKLIAGVMENQTAITETLKQFSIRWDVNRMSVVDRNIMRVAIYELQYCPDIPVLTSIDEAIEIGKEYGSERSGVFINGILNGVKDSLPADAKRTLPRSENNNQ